MRPQHGIETSARYSNTIPNFTLLDEKLACIRYLSGGEETTRVCISDTRILDWKVLGHDQWWRDDNPVMDHAEARAWGRRLKRRWPLQHSSRNTLPMLRKNPMPLPYIYCSVQCIFRENLIRRSRFINDDFCLKTSIE